MSSTIKNENETLQFAVFGVLGDREKGVQLVAYKNQELITLRRHTPSRNSTQSTKDLRGYHKLIFELDKSEGILFYDTRNFVALGRIALYSGENIV
jgi:hypothetical protein